MRPTTIKDLARAAGVTHATVSKALNGHPSISARTRERILSLASAMNYQPNLIARQLSERRGRTIGIAWPGLGATWIGYLAGQIHDILVSREYGVLFSLDPPEKAVSILTQRMVDGIILGRRGTAEEQLELLNWRRSSSKSLVTAAFKLNETIPSVDSNRLAAIALAVSHLAKSGRRRVALVSHQLDKIAGYQQGVLENDLTYQPGYLQEFSYGFDRIKQALDHLLHLSEPPDAIIVGNAQGAIHAIHYLLAKGIAVPDRMAVVGYDEIPGCDELVVPLTTVGPPATEIAKAVADVLLETIEQSKQVIHITIQPRIMIRKSCGAKPG